MDEVLGKIDDYYTGRLREHGATPRGVDWNSAASQEIRFDQLLEAVPEDACTVVDYGCGYGAFYPYLVAHRPKARYVGYDVSASMLESARDLHPAALFVDDLADAGACDVLVASGVFSVQMDVATDAWERYIETTLDLFARSASRAFAFNMLTIYSDADRMRPDLYYADPHRIFDRCREHYSRWVAMLHDYGLYEFTTIVRLEARR